MFREDVSILVVDDVNSMRIQIRELLKSFGFNKIRLVSNGMEAQEALISEKFQLVLADWYMDPVDGIELLHYVRSNPESKDMCFIMVTAEGTREKVIEAIKMGVDDYVVKPLTQSQIQSKIYRVLAKKKVVE